MRVDKKIRKEATAMLLAGSTLTEVQKWLVERDVHISQPSIIYWRTHPVKDKAQKPGGKPVKGFTDGCKFSIRPEKSPMNEARESSICAIARVPCGGAAVSKAECPLWSGSHTIV